MDGMTAIVVPADTWCNNWVQLEVRIGVEETQNVEIPNRFVSKRFQMYKFNAPVFTRLLYYVTFDASV